MSDDEKKPGGLNILIILVVIALVVGLLLARDRWLPWLKNPGAANGEKCEFDSDCRSDSCPHTVCMPVDGTRGEHCDEDKDCSSGSCRLRLCD